MQSTGSLAQPAALHEPAAASSGGELLPQDVHAPLQSRIGVDIGRIRIHSDQEAAQRARALEARAFTLGEHINSMRGNIDRKRRTDWHCLPMRSRTRHNNGAALRSCNSHPWQARNPG